MFKSIKLKLIFYFSLFISIILIGTSYLLYQNNYVNQISHLDGSLYIIMNSLVHEIQEQDEDIETEIEEVQQIFKINLLHVCIINYNKVSKCQSIIAKSSQSKNLVFPQFNFQNKYSNNIMYKTVNKYRIAMQLIQLEDNTLQLIQTAVIISFKKDIIMIIILINIIILIFFLLGSYLIISKTLLPVYNVVKSVNEIEAYNYTKRVSSKNIPNEIKVLVDTFNKLLVRHQESFNKISQFSSDTSHELKTPLTTIRGELEVGLRRERNAKEYQKIMQKSLLKIIKIQELIDSLLFLAKSDKLKIKSSFDEIYIDEIISESVEDLKEMAHSKSIHIKMYLIPLTIKGDSRLLKIACINILKNAILYSPKDTEIKIFMEKHNSKFRIFFQDQGIGISKEDIKYIFDRFYRVNKVKSKVNIGTGLGLSIVKIILDIHGFTILIESKLHKGTTIKLSI